METRHLLRRLAVVAAVFIVVVLVPAPAGVTPAGWRLLAVFAATIVGIMVRPLPMGAMVLLGIAGALLVDAVSLTTALSGFSNSIVWLVVAAFLFARAFLVTGLGRRVAFLLVRAFGRSTLGLAYALVLTDLALAPATSSNTARAGGILYPVVRALASALGSEPGATARRGGAYLLLTVFQCDLVISAMFLTAMAANPLAAAIAQEVAGVELGWGRWALAALVPGLVALAVLPRLVLQLYPPEVYATPEAPALAGRELKDMGPLKPAERGLLVVFALLLGVWATSELHGVDTTTVAIAALALLLVLRVLSWRDVLGEGGAWDALIWVGGLVMMAGQLLEGGVIKAFSDAVEGRLAGLAWLVALIVLLLLYLIAHYGFASITAHITALYPAFLAVALAAGAPPLLAAFTLAFFSNFHAGMTHYGGGAAPIYFGAGYIELADWWRLGLVVTLINAAIWIAVGFPYWKLIGLW